MVDGELDRALDELPEDMGEVLYRGWMLTADEYEALHSALSDRGWYLVNLGSPPYVLKDHVKSVKEDWRGCCLIPAGADRGTFNEICSRFIAQRDDRFEGGLVFKRFLPLSPLANQIGDSTYNDEYRLFFWRGDLVLACPYHEQGSPPTTFGDFAHLGSRIASSFFTVDVARLITGGWTVVEVGDGGVSTIPKGTNPSDLYEAVVGHRRRRDV